MSTVQRFLGLFRDSPTYGRDRANLISGFGVGLVGLLLNAAVLMFIGPLMLSPDDGEVRSLTDNVEFGQLLALILLGGATVFATVLIPFRLVTVFWEPRIGRYFDQIVLSGITPLRFVIGKATSQNLFLALTLFLLLPYLMLSLTLGGVNFGYFVAGLFLVWLYCMALALVTLWVSLYLNELLSAIVVIAAAGFLSVMGTIRMKFQLFVMTPFPALIQPVYAAIPVDDGSIQKDYLVVFLTCAWCMLGIICMSLFAIYLGPLYGIIRENSTFGEVVRDGDSKRKRWFRIRFHIQRSSEVAFFYQNRSRVFLPHEGLIRWGIGFCGLLFLSLAIRAAMVYEWAKHISSIQLQAYWQAMQFHSLNLLIHVFELMFAVILFSHAKNTAFLRLPFLRGRTVEVSRLDTSAFVFFLLLSSAISIALPIQFETYISKIGSGFTIFPEIFDHKIVSTVGPVDFVRTAIEGTVVISLCGLVVFSIQRFVCLMTWMRSVTFVSVAMLYLIIVCLLPLFLSYVFTEIHDLHEIPMFAESAPIIGMISPFMVSYSLFNGGLAPPMPADTSTAPFYVVHIALFVFSIVGIRYQGHRVRQMYLTPPNREAI